jgi:transcriptional regulator with XRE-family HTH domain
VTEPTEQDLRRQFGAAVKHYREDVRRMSQFKLAVATDLHPQTISDIERGVTGTLPATRATIAAALGVTVADLTAQEPTQAAS